MAERVDPALMAANFPGWYFELLQNQPDVVHKVYTDESTMIRIDGGTRETATTMLQIKQLVTALNYTEIEIKRQSFLECWKGEILLMVCGSVRIKDLSIRKMFVESFYLARQVNGLFVRTDLFQCVDEEQILQNPVAPLPQGNLDANYSSSETAEQGKSSCNKPDSSKQHCVAESSGEALVSSPFIFERSRVEAPILEDEVEVKMVYVDNVPSTISDYDIAEEFKKFGKLEHNGVVITTPKYKSVSYAIVAFEDISGVKNAIEASVVQIGAHQLHIERLISKRNIPLREGKDKVEENDPVSKYKDPKEHLKQTTETRNILDDEESVDSSSLIKKPLIETQKHTYASILAKGKPSCDKPDSFEQHRAPESPPRQASVSSPNIVERSRVKAPVLEDEVQVKQVYVGNVPSTISVSDIAEEFKKFGILEHDGVVIKTPNDKSANYAFVAFEDISGVQNAIEASMVKIGEHQLYIKPSRPKGNVSLGEGRGRFGETIAGKKTILSKK